MRSLVISLCCSAQEVAACWGKAKGTKRDLSCCVFLLLRTVHEGKHLAQLRNTDVPLEFCLHVMLWVWWQEIPWAAALVQWSGYPHRAVTVFMGLWCFSPKIIQSPLSAQAHHLMQSQLRSSGLSPGNWHCLNSQRICRVIKFFKRFSGFVLVFGGFFFPFSCLDYLKHMKWISWCVLYSRELDKTLQDLLLLCPWIVWDLIFLPVLPECGD